MGSKDTKLTAEQRPDGTDSCVEKASMQEQIECLEQKIAQKEDRILRIRADFENYQKRVQREMPVMISQEKDKMLLKFLEVYENLVAACQAHDDKGLHMVRDQLWKVFQEEGIVEIPTEGQLFDYQCHHAVATEPSQEHKEGIIMKEIRKGYSRQDRVIKPSYVIVSRSDTNGKNNRD